LILINKYVFAEPKNSCKILCKTLAVAGNQVGYYKNGNREKPYK
jgi:hypothetical protein